MKKLLALTLCAITIFSMTACGNTSESTEDLVEIPNPFIDCDSLEDAIKIAGFEIRVPDSIDGYSNRFIQAIDQYMIQVFYYTSSEISDDTGNTTFSENTEITENAAYTEDSRDQILLRKAIGTDDISGDYNCMGGSPLPSANHRAVTTIPATTRSILSSKLLLFQTALSR